MKIPKQPATSPDDPLNYRLHTIYRALDRGVSFGTPEGGSENIDGVHATPTIPTANVDFAVTHNLGRIPTGFNVVNKNAFSDVMRGATPWTTTQIYIQVSVAPVSLTLFIY